MIKFGAGNLRVPKWTRPVYLVAAGTTDFRKRYPEKKIEEFSVPNWQGWLKLLIH